MKYKAPATQNLELEIKVIERFVQEQKQERFIQFVSSSKNRGKFILELPHFSFFKPELMTNIISDEQAVVIERLRRAGVEHEECYVISEGSTIDTRVLPIPFAICEIAGYNVGTILVFGDAEMIFFQGEGLRQRWISEKIA